MRQFREERENNKKYLTLLLDHVKYIDKKAIKRSNKLRKHGVLKCHLIKKIERFSYQVTSLTKLSSLLSEDRIDKSYMVFVLKEIIRIIEKLKEHSIDTKYLLISADYIYIDENSYQLYFIIVPLFNIHDTVEESIYHLVYRMTDTLRSSNYDESSFVFNIRNNVQNFELNSFKSYLERIPVEKEYPNIKETSQNIVKKWVYILTLEQLVITLVFIFLYIIKGKQFGTYALYVFVISTLINCVVLIKVYIKGKKRKLLNTIEYERLNIEEIGQSIQNNKVKYTKNLYLITNKYSILIDKYPFVIGRSQYNNFVIDNPIVSAKHASIIKEKDKYYIIDHHSTNGTRINDSSILTNQKTELKNNDTVTFANLSTYTIKVE